MRKTLVILTIIVPFGLIVPGTMVHLKAYIPYLLGLIMFSMGLSLSFNDFKEALYAWKTVVLGVLLQFTLMPCIALLSGYVVGWTSPLFIGMLLVGCSPGGTASNVIVYLGKGNVPLSILMTLCSTLLSPFLTPFLLQLLAGKSIEFDVIDMFLSIATVVIAPLLLGVIIPTYTPQFANKIRSFGPTVSSIAIALIIATVLALNYGVITNDFPLVCLLMVASHNILGYSISYFTILKLSGNKKKAFTIATEVAMQNSGLAVNLARTFFTALPLATLPGALFSLWHNASGLLMATISQKRRD